MGRNCPGGHEGNAMPRTQPFDDYLDDYESWFDEHRYVYLSEVAALRNLMPKEAKGVEIGIGTGRFALPLGIPEGVEPSVRMREFAAQQGLTVYAGVAENLPLADKSYDLALMVTTVCFVDDIGKSFREAHRILKPGGSVIVGLVDRDSPLGEIYQAMKQSNKFYRIATFFSVTEVVHHLKEARFGDIKTVQTVFGALESISATQPLREGHGDGGFVAIKATRPASPTRLRSDTG
jgi:SAM-dependent methyltransferase